MPVDVLARYRAFFETHDVTGAPERRSASKGSYALRMPVNAIIAEVLDEEHFGSLTPRQRAYVRAIRGVAHDLLVMVTKDEPGLFPPHTR
jgi:hypothetical protein